MIKKNKIDILKKLKDRNILYQVTNKNNLYKILNEKKINLYCGFDLTADSLHIGHLIQLITLKYFQELGHKPIILLGGATSLIGDPSFKLKKRKINFINNINLWCQKISLQINNFLDFNCGSNSAIIINNYEWFHRMDILFFLKKIGKYFCVNQMINKDAIKKRMINNNNEGISFTEFSYNLLQSYDFAYLNKNFDVILQIGGSDQWGHIVSGIDLTKKICKKKVFGLTTNLIIKNDGKKFGKTENETIWLDQKKTSTYKFFQYWLNIPDSIVFNFLNMFTNYELKIINSFNKKKNNVKKKSPQYLLAEYMTNMVHGKDNLIISKKITNLLFYKNINNFSENDFLILSKNIKYLYLENKNINLQTVLILSKFTSSKNRASILIKSNSIYINNESISDISFTFAKYHKKFNHFTLLRKGKKNFCLIYWK
ncbi:tyrosine--tRNA ligase [Enterobacteriaceae endosymbiont of Donacia bicoloricornis]|uniref:tyrosine--tRNA ligase n=1 Tax=Enterobacteriaceae endosymbiont of Donacia bicoloricornis TaxID=2675772 RepID=UPI00144953E1|nr:tyrosine--tRNA ligase [Enterobacteriaceae endosymbiont of Donacia bicoloricornis]QJC37645.1 tyrosine--tRNA ligase [Enterobacteriaceae endosymbiont of Donacia bicoloricornis]